MLLPSVIIDEFESLNFVQQKMKKIIMEAVLLILPQLILWVHLELAGRVL